MKTCPVCQAVAFDDASTCFGCMYEFNGEEPMRPTTPAGTPPEFCIRFTPLPDQSGSYSWKCAVEV